MDSEKRSWPYWFFILGFIGGIQYLIFSLVAMQVYPGGTVHDPSLESYSFATNFFSDLGRTRNFRGESNFLSYIIHTSSLSVAGATLILYFIALPRLFESNVGKGLSLLTAFLGVLAGVCYIGIANVPWNVSYWGHVFYVRLGFVAFLIMSLFYSIAILSEKKYPNRYAIVLILFALILGAQIILMFYGERSWRSPEALFRQATAQKVVVYAELSCMLYQSWGAMHLYKKQQSIVIKA